MLAQMSIIRRIPPTSSDVKNMATTAFSSNNAEGNNTKGITDNSEGY